MGPNVDCGAAAARWDVTTMSEAPLREAIAIGEASLGEEDEDVVTAVNSLAVLFK